jgi:SAM-dependent methyltransferase
MNSPSNDSAREVWERIADFWDTHVGADGNDFHRKLIEPATDRLLAPQKEMHILDLACGNAQYARHLTTLGCSVLAVDGSSAFLARAKDRSKNLPIEFRQVDLTDESQIAALPQNTFDAAVATMALMDLPDIAPLFRALPQLLKPRAPFVFSVAHPCFNSAPVRMHAELIQESGKPRQIHGVLITDYLTPRTDLSAGIINQPEPHYFFHRPLHALLNEAFKHGWILDGLDEPAFPKDTPAKSAFSQAKRPEIPPALVARLRYAASSP